MRRWMKANIQSIDAKATSVVLDKTSKAANSILKVHFPFHRNLNFLTGFIYYIVNM